ncbi:CatB-related O-acetyltransferase [Caballeronia sp. LP006]|uniref:CatB-related O-acetyltransferase n=1 Tax=Caballeronia sp. LP006 TaxID=3038552 RepID=UPI002856FDEB|nr:CatB-related O-acetyltransferase [Caballeronia sp. LP006]MDR5830987.1 CatB-related O-acetyltransferase [Caballeronia sp. LP006]
MKPLSKFFSRKAPQPAVEVPLPPPEVTDGRFFFPVQEIRVAVGNHSHINRPTVYYWGAPCAFEVGHYCSIAQGATFVLGGEHPKLSLSTNTTLHQINASNRWKGDVVIGNDVWVGANTTILSGVTIHTGAIIGAGATISKDVPAYAIVVGNPQRVLRHRFEPDVIARLLDSRWWEHDPETLNPLLMKSTDINDFLMLFENSV